ncbi:hypothetical protein F4778DRAFT_767099 [Xylariomycetidae sp. FL2044]|nr:hypothetical protein F4778DRAFT_767099 [Xylariomycetidae sp. FL2044]
MSSTQPRDEPTLKDRLDQAAKESRHQGDSPPQNQSSLVEKVVEYLPAAASVLGSKGPDQGQKPADTPPAKDLSGPPERPHHDGSIEEFVRHQHRSKKPDGGFAA